MINTWQEMLELIKDTKKCEHKKNIKLDVRSLYTMLYSGHFDSLFDHIPTAKEYEELAPQLAKALGSVAQLPKATKTQKYGIVDIKGSTLMLHLWRSQSNPIYSFNFLDFLKDQIEQQGFIKHPMSKTVPYRRTLGKNDNKQRSDLWSSYKVLEKNKEAQIMYKNDDGCSSPCFVGLITDVRKFKYSDNTKEALKFKVFLGEGSTTDIVAWPKRDEDKVSDTITKQIKEGKLALITTRCGEYKGNLSLTFKHCLQLDYKE